MNAQIKQPDRNVKNDLDDLHFKLPPANLQADKTQTPDVYIDIGRVLRLDLPSKSCVPDCTRTATSYLIAGIIFPARENVNRREVTTLSYLVSLSHGSAK